MWLRQMAQLSTTRSQLHSATAFHFLISNIGAEGAAAGVAAAEEAVAAAAAALLLTRLVEVLDEAAGAGAVDVDAEGTSLIRSEEDMIGDAMLSQQERS